MTFDIWRTVWMEVPPHIKIEEAVAEAVEGAEKLASRVEFDFNGHRLYANPHENTETVLARWGDLIKAARLRFERQQ